MRFIIQIPYKVPKEVFKVDKSFKPRSMVTKRTIEVTKAFGLGIDEEKEFTIFKNFEVEINLGEVVLTYGASGIEKMALRDFEQKLSELEVKNPHSHVALVSSECLEPKCRLWILRHGGV